MKNTLTLRSLASARLYLHDTHGVEVSRRTLLRRIEDGTLSRIRLGGRRAGEIEIVLIERELDAYATTKARRGA